MELAKGVAAFLWRNEALIKGKNIDFRKSLYTKQLSAVCGPNEIAKSLIYGTTHGKPIEKSQSGGESPQSKSQSGDKSPHSKS